MPKMISLRDFRLATMSGHVLIFESRVARDVPAAAVEDALAAGCAMINANETPDFDTMELKTRFDLEADLRQSVIFLVCKMLAEQNKVQHFDGGGAPREGVVSDILGFEVGKKELVTVWQIYLAAKSEGREHGLHADAVSVLEIIQAETKNDLLDIAKARGIPDEEVDGKQAKTIRAYLLKQFPGAILA
jgi:hypothetical protein